ncbi:MAG TPA: ATP-binding protein [Stellaceae bacterium]|jgi:signal transduction histidine kinase|nr:ATP-binding protein [Stellaceae bacterium]
MSVIGGILQAAAPFRPRLSRRVGLTLYYGAIVGVGLLTIFGKLSSPGEGALKIDRAEYGRLTDIDAPAPLGWDRVDLPHRCLGASSATRCAALFRLSFEGPGADAGPWALYMPIYSGRLRIRLNGTYLADTRDIRTSVVLNQAEPLLVALPQPPLRDGNNDLEIRVGARTGTRLATFIDQVYVGPAPALRPSYERRYGLLKTLPRLFVAWQAALGLALLIVWFGRRQEWMYLTLSGILCLGVLHGLTEFLSAGAAPTGLLIAANLTAVWQASLMPGLVAELVERRSPLSLKWAVSLPAVVTAVFVLRLAYPVALQPWFPVVWAAAALPWTTGLELLAMWIVGDAAFRRNDAAAQILFGGFLMTAIVAARDLLVFFGLLPSQQVILTQFTFPLLMTIVSAILMWRFAIALNEVSRFNQVLRQEVAAVESALRASFAREQAQIRTAALENERLRLTRDLHDGLAGQLVSIVAQCELQGGRFLGVSDAARRALDDLRLVVASLDDVGNDLAMMLAKFRERIEPQLHDQQIELDWQMTPLPDVEGLRSEHALALFRVLQEAVTNAARHSGSRRITIAMTAASEDQLEVAVQIVVADNGRGGAAPRPGGNGFANMQRRAHSLGAGLAIESGAAGTRIVIRLPRALPPVPAP